MQQVSQLNQALLTLKCSSSLPKRDAEPRLLHACSRTEMCAQKAALCIAGTGNRRLPIRVTSSKPT